MQAVIGNGERQNTSATDPLVISELFGLHYVPKPRESQVSCNDNPRKGRKFEQVLEGARQVFMADGYEGASVDAIAKTAKVSKATLYSYFPDKRHLFTQVARAECQQLADQATASIDLTAPVAQVLRAAAEHMVGFILSDFSQSIYRVCVAESDRFPELGREFYESGPQLGIDAMVAYFDLACERGELEIDDKPLAASQFQSLCKVEIFEKRVFGVNDRFEQAEIDRVINGAVDMFLARYGA